MPTFRDFFSEMDQVFQGPFGSLDPFGPSIFQQVILLWTVYRYRTAVENCVAYRSRLNFGQEMLRSAGMATAVSARE